MKPEELYRIEKRLQNGLNKYYLIREIFSDGRKFSASHLIKTGAVPSRAEVVRCAGMYGFDLEMKCIDKAAKFRAGVLRTESEADDAVVFEVERFRLLSRFVSEYAAPADVYWEVAELSGGFFSREELAKMFVSGKVPSGRTVSDVVRAVVLKDVVASRKKERLSAASLKKLHALLHLHDDAALPGGSDLVFLQKRLASFYLHVGEGYHPLEQAGIFYEEASVQFPDEEYFVREIFIRLAGAFGYRIAPMGFADAVNAACEANPLLELDVRSFIRSEFRVHSGARQRQLDFFGGK